MPNEIDIRNLLTQPLDTILRKLYTNGFLSWLYQEIIEPLFQTHPMPQVPGVTIPPAGSKKALRKDDKIEIIKAVLQDDTLKRAFFALLPEPLRVALTALTWHEPRSLAALETLAGVTLADPHPIEPRRSFEPFIVRQPYEFICLLRKNDNHYYYYDVRKDSKDNIHAYLPLAMRKVFKGIIPPPPDYELRPMDEPPPATRRYLAVDALRDLKAAAEFIEQGHAKYTKSEKISKVSVRKFREVIRGEEFFGSKHSGGSDQDLVRTQMLLGIVSFAGNALRQSLCNATSADPLKELLPKLSPAFLEEELLWHINHSRDAGMYNRHVVARLTRFAAEIPTGKWVSAQNMLNYFKYRDEIPSVFASTANAWMESSFQGYGYQTPYAYYMRLFSQLGEPLIKGYAFLLATLGMAEIAYTPPEEGQVTPFIGLAAVRLTPLGEFVVGKRKTLDIEVASVLRSEVLLDSNRLMASCRNLDAMTELALKQFLERITQSRFRMTHTSLLGGCSSREALEERIALFRRVIAAEPPPIWEQFFTQTLNRIAPLQRDGELLVFKLDTDEETRRLFSTDPVLRKHCLKVEGYRIAVRHQDIKTVCKQLEKAGCLCPPATLLETLEKAPSH